MGRRRRRAPPGRHRRTVAPEGLGDLAVAVRPVLLRHAVPLAGVSDGPSRGDWESVRIPVAAGQHLGEVRPLFPRLERPAPPTPAAAPSPKPAADGSLPPLDIRAARIVHVENHPSADRLYVLTVEAGEPRPRTVVAGLRDSYVPEQLTGRMVALLANLEPRTIRRITSQGMILAADVGGKAALLEIPDGVEPGRAIGPTPGPSRAIAYSEFESTPLLVGRAEPSEGPAAHAVSVGRTVAIDRAVSPGASVVVRFAGPESTEGTVLGFDDDHLLKAPAAAAPGTRVR